jgi:hypothetical protein
MQMQAIIEATPGSGRRVTCLEDADGNLALFQAGGGCQPGWPCANDEHWFRCALSHSFILPQYAPKT